MSYIMHFVKIFFQLFFPGFAVRVQTDENTTVVVVSLNIYNHVETPKNGEFLHVFPRCNIDIPYFIIFQASIF